MTELLTDEELKTSMVVRGISRPKDGGGWSETVELPKSYYDRLLESAKVWKANLEEAVEALKQYADRTNYDGKPSAIDFDDGELARETLARIQPTPKSFKLVEVLLKDGGLRVGYLVEETALSLRMASVAYKGQLREDRTIVKSDIKSITKIREAVRETHIFE